MISSGGAPGLAFSYSPAGQQFNPLTLISGSFPTGPNEIDIDASTASKHDYKAGDEIGVVARGPVEQFQIVGHGPDRPASPRSAARRWRSSRCPTAQRLFNKVGKLDRSASRAKHGYSPQQVVDADQAAARPERAGARPAQQQAQQATKRHERLPQHLPGLPARVRRHRAVRRQLRDRQHAVDHDRAANARAGDAAHARRDPPPGAALGPGRGVRDRDARLDRRPVPRARCWPRRSIRCWSSFGINLPAGGTVFKTRTIVIVAARRASSSR